GMTKGAGCISWKPWTGTFQRWRTVPHLGKGRRAPQGARLGHPATRRDAPGTLPGGGALPPCVLRSLYPSGRRGPIKYFTRWRMHQATRLLKNDVEVVKIAALLGYDSEVAFRKAFKREVGMPPARYRKYGGPVSMREHPITDLR